MKQTAEEKLDKGHNNTCEHEITIYILYIYIIYMYAHVFSIDYRELTIEREMFLDVVFLHQSRLSFASRHLQLHSCTSN